LVGFLQFLPGDVGQLGFCDKVFGFRADELLFESHDLGRSGVFVFEMSYLIGDFGFVLAGGVNRGFGVADLFESLTRSLERTSVVVFNFGNFTTKSAHVNVERQKYLKRTPSLSEISDTESSPVSSPQSESCPATFCCSFAAASYAYV